MAKYNIMKAVEFDKLPAKFKAFYQDIAGLRAAGYWLQKKYDGCMGIVAGGRMLSRTGEDYTASCSHIVNHLEDQDWVLIGEVWHPEFPFPTISGDFRRQRPSPHLQFVINDILLATEWEAGYSEVGYRERMRRQRFIPNHLPYRFAETYTSYSWFDGITEANNWKAEGGFDGAICRDPEGTYTVGTVKKGEIIKIKPVMSLDLEIVGISSQPGEKTGRPVWTIDVEHLPGGEPSTGRNITTVGSGMPHTLTSDFQVGAIAEVEFMGWTTDGFLREPRFKGIRHDKDKPDA